jgi:hypothetical protein
LICGLAQVYQVEAKYPAIAFKQQLTALLEKVYGMIRHNLKKELSPLLGLCIQVRSSVCQDVVLKQVSLPKKKKVMTQQGFQSSPAGATHIRRQSQRIVFAGNRSGATSLHGALAEHHQDLDKFSRCSEIKLRASSESQNCRNIYASLFFSLSLSLFIRTRLIPSGLVALQVPPFLICKMFTQVFSFINVQLFNRYCTCFMNITYYRSSVMNSCSLRL